MSSTSNVCIALPASHITALVQNKRRKTRFHPGKHTALTCSISPALGMSQRLFTGVLRAGAQIAPRLLTCHSCKQPHSRSVLQWEPPAFCSSSSPFLLVLLLPLSSSPPALYRLALFTSHQRAGMLQLQTTWKPPEHSCAFVHTKSSLQGAQLLHAAPSQNEAHFPQPF